MWRGKRDFSGVVQLESRLYSKLCSNVESHAVQHAHACSPVEAGHLDSDAVKESLKLVISRVGPRWVPYTVWPDTPAFTSR